MELGKERITIVIGGAIIGVIAALLVLFGNPQNMGMCVACFIRDTVGGLGLHQAAPVQYVRPEIMGLVLGSTVMALVSREWAPRGGSSPMTRLVLGFFAMIGCLVFLGCPFRTILRIAGGDLNAIVGLVGFACGILVGTVFLSKGYSLGRSSRQGVAEGAVWPVVQLVIFGLLVAVPALLVFSAEGPGSKHAAIAISLVAGLLVGAIAQRTRLCMVGGVRDLALFREPKLIMGFVAVLIAAFVTNVVMSQVTGTSFVNIGFEGQPIAHTDGVWNFLGMGLAGFACVLLGGCPLRQLIMSGEGNTDSAVTIVGLALGAAFSHLFGLASSTNGATPAGQIAVIVGFVVIAAIAVVNTVSVRRA